ncbi:unnamed protein product [Onchocerca flexuosa]|uniref:Uncharacterized protein n=1 Tax=Onchocerca flexuosa TaxID=387005 RepID=A0A183HTS5_9BILA|nr:unnamed protein product [Onchocerca flexuosa]
MNEYDCRRLKERSIVMASGGISVENPDNPENNLLDCNRISDNDAFQENQVNK